MKRIKKACALALLGGMVFGFGGGCLGGFLRPQRLLREAAAFSLFSFTLDNPAVFDLFPENTTGGTTNTAG